MKEQYSSATTDNGEQCVMIFGVAMMQMWSVDNLDTRVCLYRIVMDQDKMYNYCV